ncbi:GumP protein [Oceanicola granulosus HTCC2516]|uniref:GumP protein n=1 Tax=Oceanicola granulosus (strain ATCC BAA-861 / DSM 15982 / KCTC 12143 / HTCC2516) TaxID=314256 RepID=Q2CFC3_OCEGH|nr:MBL fold metallo-hydrolase [Oceanicola granulosus]EAR51372.1 GumP protein [Oceanicola granulosus HTCC2516]
MDLSFHVTATVPAHERMLRHAAPWRKLRLPVRFGLLRHPRLGAVLIDTGYSAHALHAPGRSAGLRAYGKLLRPSLVAGGSVADVLAAHRLAPADVAAVILTHLHPDHVSGLTDFPAARIHLAADAGAALAARHPMRQGLFPELLPADLATRTARFEDAPAAPQPGGLGLGHDVFGDGSVFAIPLPGHAPGHVGLRFAGDGLLYAADTEWLRSALPDPRLPPLPLRAIVDDAPAFLASKTRVAAFAAAGGDVLLCHQPERHRLDRGTWT